jgi:CelD/BcsL family acetyltransferase involved in cellulose biosynthesis
MRVDVIPIKELSQSMKRDWLKMQASNPGISGPFFHPELFVSVGQYCPDIFVALLYRENKLAGFLPFQNNRKLSAARPMRFCNFQAVICDPSQSWDVPAILKKIKINSWEFEAFVGFENMRPREGDFQINNSLRIDLTGGLEGYWAFIKTKQLHLKDLDCKQRKLRLIKGPLRFVPNCDGAKTLHKFVQWKISRYDHNPQWASQTEKMLEHIYRLEDPLFQAVMPALYAGDELLAVDFHIRYQGHLGGLHRAFNPHYEKFSVGILLLHEIINLHKELEFNIFDLGPGVLPYKVDYSNSSLAAIKGTFKADSVKEKIKSINWLYQCLLPVARFKRRIAAILSYI